MEQTVVTTVKPSLKAADLPPAVRVFWDTAPCQFRVASILTAIDCYCALATRLRAMYVYDPQTPHAMLLQLLVLGEPGSGKSFTRNIVQQIMHPLRMKDLEQRRIEQNYSEMKRTMSKNRNLPDEPVTCIRNLQTITKAKLVKRADMFIRKYGEPLAFFFFNEELATMTDSNKRAFADLNTMDRLAYDLGAEYGSDTLSEASYNADVDIIYCSLFCGTENALAEYMNKRSIEGGNCTRKVLTRIDGDSLGSAAPVFRNQTDAERELVDRTVRKLMDETYTEDDGLQPILMLDMAWMDSAVRRWCEEQRRLAVKTGSNALNCFYKRSSVSAWRMTCLLYHLWGGESADNVDGVRRSCVRFYRFMAQYILDGLLDQWGRQYDEMHRVEPVETKRSPSLYDMVPQQFTRDQLNELCAKLRMSPGRIFLHKWMAVKLIHQPDSDVELYVKNYK